MNKLLLAIIALGLWANAAVSLFRPAHAQGDDVGQIAYDIHSLVTGGLNCQNKKLCN
jgi:hypothetical protein